MISSVCVLVLGLLAVPAQSAEQALESYRKGSDLFGRGSIEEALRLAEEAVKARPDTEGLLRVRVGAGLEDREFEPRRLAGDACLALGRKAALPAERAKQIAAAVAWYQGSLDRGLKKSAALIAAAKEEGAKDLVDAAKRELAAMHARGHYETAFASLEQRRAALPAPAAEALRAETESAFRRWQDGLLAELREDLKRFSLGARWARYRVAPEQASRERRDPALDWAAGLADLKDPYELETRLDAAAALGLPYFQAAQGFLLARYFEAIRDPGPSKPLDDRWTAFSLAETTYGDALTRARKRAQKVTEASAWLEPLAAAEAERLNALRGALPDRAAVKAVSDALQRLRGDAFASGAKADPYASIEAELEGLLEKAPSEKGRIRAGQLLARCQALFLSGASREDVLSRSAELRREADPALLVAWAPDVSPRVKWIFEQERQK